MATFYRRDDWVTDALGNAQPGAQVYVCTQPANTGTIPPSPLASLFADSAGATPIAQPVLTDGYGHAAYYLAPGTYTVVYFSPQIQETILPDQSIAPGGVSIPVAVNQGGTGAITAPAALTNLGAAASGANVDITSLGDIPNTVINGTGYVFETPYGTSANGVTIANESFAGSGYTGPGVGVESPSGGTVIGAGQVITQTVSSVNINATGTTNAGATLKIGTGTAGTPGVIESFSAGQSLTIGPLGNTTNQTAVLIKSSNVTPTSGQGLLGFDSEYFTQTTVGAAGGASALPATPRGYLQFTAPDGTICVFPFYAHS